MGCCAKKFECTYLEIFNVPMELGRLRLLKIGSKSRQWFETEKFTKTYYETLWKLSEPTLRKACEIEYIERVREGMSYKNELLPTTC